MRWRAAAGLVVMLGMATLPACSKEQRLVQHNRETERFAEDVLPDEDLAAAVPAGFEFDSVQRNGPVRHAKDWITVGVRMEGPIPFARAIFYVHPAPEAAGEMYEKQTEDARDMWEMFRGERFRGAKIPPPFVVDELKIPNQCGFEPSGLYRCHARVGRVYLVTESTAGGGPGRNEKPTAKEKRAAKDLIQAFGGLLRTLSP